jgi:hypothetical protein
MRQSNGKEAGANLFGWGTAYGGKPAA